MDPVLLTKTIQIRRRVESGENVIVEHICPRGQEKEHCFDILECECVGCQMFPCCWPDIEDGPLGRVLVTHKWIQ